MTDPREKYRKDEKAATEHPSKKYQNLSPVAQQDFTSLPTAPRGASALTGTEIPIPRVVEPMSPATAIARSLGQAVPFVGTFSDEAEAGLRGLLSGKDYKTEHAKIQAQRELFAKEYPGFQGSLEIGGSIVTGAGLASKLAIRGLSKLVAFGMAEGYLTGFGQGEPGRRKTTAITGAALGGAIPLTIAGVSNIPAGVRRLKQIFGNYDISQDAANREAADIIAKRVGPGGAEIPTRTPGAMVADVLPEDASDAITRRAAFLTDDQDAVRELATKRSSDATQRVREGVFDVLGVPRVVADQYPRRMNEALAPARNKAYEELAGIAPKETEELIEIMGRPGFQDTYAQMRKLSRDYFGKELPDIYTGGDAALKPVNLYGPDGKMLPPSEAFATPEVDLSKISLSTISDIAKVLEKLAKGDVSPVGAQGPRGEAQAGLASALKKAVRNPEYAQARSLAQDIIRMREAYEEGTQIFKKTPGGVMDALTDLYSESPGNVAAYQAGATSAVGREVGSQRAHKGLASLLTSPDNSEKIRYAFSEKKLDGLMNILTQETAFDTTEKAIMAGTKKRTREEITLALSTRGKDLDLPRAYSEMGIYLAVSQEAVDRLLNRKIAPATLEAVMTGLTSPAKELDSIMAIAKQNDISREAAKKTYELVRAMISSGTTEASLRGGVMGE